jgi:hypothetical protein
MDSCGPGNPPEKRKPGTAAKYSNLPQRSLTSATPNMRPTLDFNQPNRSTPVATDQMVIAHLRQALACLLREVDEAHGIPAPCHFQRARSKLRRPTPTLSATFRHVCRCAQ